MWWLTYDNIRNWESWMTTLSLQFKGKCSDCRVINHRFDRIFYRKPHSHNARKMICPNFNTFQFSYGQIKCFFIVGINRKYSQSLLNQKLMQEVIWAFCITPLSALNGQIFQVALTFLLW